MTARDTPATFRAQVLDALAPGPPRVARIADVVVVRNATICLSAVHPARDAIERRLNVEQVEGAEQAAVDATAANPALAVYLADADEFAFRGRRYARSQSPANAKAGRPARGRPASSTTATDERTTTPMTPAEHPPAAPESSGKT